MDACPHPECEHGWRPTTPAYTEALFPVTDDMTEEQQQEALAKRRRYPVFYYPCPECRPGMFVRWSNGCFRPNHHAATCDLCVEVLGETGAKRMQRPAQGAVPR